MRRQTLFFWGFLALAAALRLALAWDQSVTMVYGPHDDTLYLRRAASLLAGEGFGPYNSTTFIKYPGLSFWLALNSFAGLPYLPALNVLFVAGGLYLCGGLRAAGVPALAVAAGALLYFFSPFTFDAGWTRVLREPLTTILLAWIAASLLFVLRGFAQNRVAAAHVAVFAVSFSVAALCREEDVLLYVIPLVAFSAALWLLRHELPRKRMAILALYVLALPLAVSAAANGAARSFVAHHYGLPILHDFGEGEFPKMIAAMRSVQTRRDNRYVMVSQEALAALRREIPRLEPVIRRLPAPGPNTVSCEWLGVCSEWAAGWFLYWIKDAAHDAGLTPTLPAGQVYFRAVREDIEAACRAGRLQCSAKGNALMPPFELRWTRALVREGTDLLRMLLRPDRVERQVPTTVHDPKLERLFADVTRSNVRFAPATLADARALEPPQWARTLQSFHGVLSMAFIVFAVVLCFYLLAEGANPFGAVLLPFLIAIGAYLVVRFAALSYLALSMGRYDARMIMSTHVLLAPLCVAFVAVALERLWHDRLAGAIHTHNG